MKELSIEQKAKRYDKALEWMRSVYPTMEGAAKEDAEHYFPELKESEDERIINNIKIALMSMEDNLSDLYSTLHTSQKELLDWLEKQQKALTVEEAMRDVEEKAKAFTEANKGLTSDEILAQMRGEGWSENESEDEKIRKWLIGYFHQYKEDGMKKYANGLKVDDIVAWLEKQSEQKLAWSEEDENGLGDALWAIQQARTIAKDENDMGNLWNAEHWLKSLKGRVQPKQECSEEDEKMVRALMSICDEWATRHSYLPKEDNDIDKIKSWLKSLKDRYTWKPSDEIMKGLNEIINKLAISPVIHEHGYLYDLMVNLRKKLKG